MVQFSNFMDFMGRREVFKEKSELAHVKFSEHSPNQGREVVKRLSFRWEHRLKNKKNNSSCNIIGFPNGIILASGQQYNII